MLRIIEAQSADQVESARALFVEYAESLGFDLCFQGFDAELERLPGEYARPEGRLLLAFWREKAAGCVGLRRFDETSCELKRMYVRPDCRGHRVGRTLAETVIGEARLIGYERMLLDTAPHMTEAITLYRSLGFRETAAYRFNPLEGALYFELRL